MIEFGKSLKAAREAKGLSITQLADITHLAPSKIEDLENENFNRIAAPIYGRGFVKLYCEAVDLDVKTFVDEFMAIFNGDHEVGIKQRTTDTAEPNTPAREQTADASIPAESAPVAVEQEKEIPPPSPPELFDVPSESATENVPASFSRYAAPIHETATPHIPRNIWRIGVLTVIAVIVLWLIACGVRALYRATSPADESTPTVAETPKEKPAASQPVAKPSATAKPAAKRTPQKIPALYID